MILIYKLNCKNIIQVQNSEFQFKIWKPGFLKFKPPDKGIKYLLFWLFYLTNIFHNKNYFAVIVYNKKNIVASLLVVPSYFKWPFMSKNDIQFTYVLTREKYRGKGLALQMIGYAAKYLKDVDTCWYVTETGNKSSMRLASKAGFELFGSGVKDFFGRLLLKL